MQPPRTLLIGTAGHIDHGKSSLVRALTGVDPDRLPEEQARGMTIDLGFAHRRVDDCDLYFVDVPGHERFLRNMVAGATGIDVALLVIAADDGVMPQTREHADVLQVLGVTRCILVVSKVDLVDPDRAAVVADDAAALLASRGISPVACIHTSAIRGDGLDELVVTLARLANEPRPAELPYTWFRLPIDRAFTIPGRGTIVTGSVAHGAVAREDELELWPAGRRVRVRDLQTHHEGVATSSGRLRLALNLAGVALSDVQRGAELATPGYLRPTQRLDVQLSRFAPLSSGRRGAHRVRLLIGTSEVLAEIRSSPTEVSPPIRAHVRTTAPVCATWGQHFVIRDESGQRTLGGGSVINPLVARAPRTNHTSPSVPATPRDRILAALHSNGWSPAALEWLASQAGLANAAESARLLESVVARGEAVRIGTGAHAVYVPRPDFDAIASELSARLQAHLQANPRVPGIARIELVAWLPRACPEKMRASLAEALIAAGALTIRGEYVHPVGARPSLSRHDDELYCEILKAFSNAGLQPPALTQLPFATPRNAARVVELSDLAVSQGALRKIAPGIYLHADTWRTAVERVRTLLQNSGPQSVAGIRDALQSSRKVVVPLVEALDAARITRRVGDVRELVTAPLP